VGILLGRMVFRVGTKRFTFFRRGIRPIALLEECVNGRMVDCHDWFGLRGDGSCV
jgi:hypothetical protein